MTRNFSSKIIQLLCTIILILLVAPQNNYAAFPISQKAEAELMFNNANIIKQGENDLPKVRKDKGVWGIISVSAGAAACAGFGLILKTGTIETKFLIPLLIVTGVLCITGVVTGIIGRQKGRKHRDLAKNGILFGITPPAIVIGVALAIFLIFVGLPFVFNLVFY